MLGAILKEKLMVIMKGNVLFLEEGKGHER